MKHNRVWPWLSLPILPVFLLLTSCQSTQAQPTETPPAPPDGEKLFMAHCATCHGAEGRRTWHGWLAGTPNLQDARVQTRITDAGIIDTIKKGPRAMPSFEKKLSPAEIEALVPFVRSLKPAAAPDEKK